MIPLRSRASTDSRLQADRELARRQARKKRKPTGGRVIHVWVNSQEQAELTKRAKRENLSLNAAAKRVLQHALALSTKDECAPGS